MDINSLKGASAYMNPLTPTGPVDQTMLQNQTSEASKADPAKENAGAAQTAFQVTITNEARERMTSEAKPETSERQSTPPPSSQGSQGVAKAYETSQIVNIVA